MNLYSCSVGVVLPVYSAFKAIANEGRDAWLTYWAAYGSFTQVQSFTDKLLSWLPMYYHVKFAFLVWLQLPISENKIISVHRAEIEYARTILLKIKGSADQTAQMPNRLSGTDQPREQLAVEGEPRTKTDTESVVDYTDTEFDVDYTDPEFHVDD